MTALIEEVSRFCKRIKMAQSVYSFYGGRKFILNQSDRPICYKQLIRHYQHLLHRADHRQRLYNNQINYKRFTALIKCKYYLLKLNTESDRNFFNNTDLKSRILQVWIRFIRLFSRSSHVLKNHFASEMREMELKNHYRSLVTIENQQKDAIAVKTRQYRQELNLIGQQRQTALKLQKCHQYAADINRLLKNKDQNNDSRQALRERIEKSCALQARTLKQKHSDSIKRIKTYYQSRLIRAH